ncbi:MAG TPA: DUF2203 domain-containing protein [Gaiellaceae bacterium]|jgi:hypothetical protein|nr:DUF2203 domain-containing protein [Gaiellaceae bacterium]
MRLFSEQEANDALGVVAPLVERLVAARGRFVSEGRRLAQLRRKVAGNGGGLDPSRVQDAQDAVEEVANEIGLLVADLEAAGVQVKDLDRGLVDFPAQHPESGDLVLLCWHLGEDRVAFWHGLEEGFAGRKPLPF